MHMGIYVDSFGHMDQPITIHEKKIWGTFLQYGKCPTSFILIMHGFRGSIEDLLFLNDS